mmetsp:Transcript_100318/g.292469  ORF Transcript_100318/g.292469 Transcript_100318/m.292469 type:complete len:479 (-) Transcript_100318:83-1519(-)
MARTGPALCLLGLLGSTAALRLEQPEASVQMVRTHSRHSSCSPPAAYRQELSNMMDLQYFTEINVGGQKITGILDTGSFELVVFSRGCFTCGRAGAYDSQRSATFKSGSDMKVLSYGSGSCKAKEATDQVTVGCYQTSQQSMWLAVDCRMQLLTQAGFQSIIGVGPPGQPEFVARETIKQMEALEVKMQTTQGFVPSNIAAAKKQAQKELENALTHTSLLESFGMKTFSHCLGRQPGMPGWMIWNDETREGQPGVVKIPVAGNITWGIKLDALTMEITPSVDTDVSEVTETLVGCEQGCGAIVDTGTSLLGVPTSTYHAIANILQKHVTANDCSDLRNFPTLIISVAGQTLRLPPSSYIGTMSGVPNMHVAKLMHLDEERPGIQESCQLLLMDLGKQMTTLGPMMILGMPLFREYYSTFDLGSGRGHRSIFLTPADEKCHPDLSGQVKYSMNRAAFTPRHIDVSKVRVPEWVGSRSAL